MNYAGTGARFLAVLIDGLILFAVGYVLGLVLGGQEGENGALLQVLSIIVQIAYLVFYQGSTGQTVGKKVMKIKVVDANGNKPSYLTFFLRDYIGKAISAIIFFIGFFMILWDKNKQGLHDKIASTYVVKAAGEVQKTSQPSSGTPAQK